MDRLAEQVVAWHNRHPLAKRISIYDVHTIGVVALPFMRSGRPAVPAGPIEPVMTDSTEPSAAPPPTAPPAKMPWWQVLTPVLAKLGLARDDDAAWPLFSERFINTLSARRIARFALRHGHGNPPGEPDWPQRDVAIDEALMARGAARAAGAWPFEIYLMSAGIDAGPSRTRVLLARGAGGRMEVLGRRCLNPLPLIALGALLLLGLGLGGWWLFKGAATPGPDSAAPAASATSAAASSPAAPASALAQAMPMPMPVAAPASAAASLPDPVASAPSAPAPAETASEPVPDIRPRLVRPLPTRQAPAAEPASAPMPAPKPSPTKPAAALAEELNRPGKPARPAEPGKAADKDDGLPLAAPGAAPAGKQVALVGPASASKAEAEATLERMRGMLGQTVRDASGLQAQVFQTHEGWRAAIWPFGSREEAQLINATLIARGMKTRAVDF